MGICGKKLYIVLSRVLSLLSAMVTQEELEKMSPEEILELQKQNCPFCKIVAGQIPSSKVLETKNILAILDINPAAKGHCLVLPKEHVPILPIIPPPVFKELFRTAKTITPVLRKTQHAEGTTLFIANGAVAGQQTSHFLYHLIPREKTMASVISLCLFIKNS